RRARPVVVQGVQHMLFKPETLAAWPHGRPRTELVFIARHFNRKAAARSVQPFFPGVEIEA
ncbi:MAG: GTP-binding protein, partial [Alphaproteobacteria bacterium]